MTRSLRVPNESDDAFRARAERAAGHAKILVEAALANHCIQSFIADPQLPYTEQGERRSPTVRIEYEEAFAIGGIGECLQATRNKSWGDGPNIQPLRPDDPVDPARILYVFKEGSRYNLRFEQRQRLKQLLGRKYRPLVQMAKGLSKSVFFENLTAEQAYAIRRILQIDPTTFWQASRGRIVELPNQPSKLDATELAGIAEKPRQLRIDFDAAKTRKGSMEER